LIRMETHGLLKRTKNMERRNQIRITLTAKGEIALKKAMKLEGTTHVLSRLTAAQQKQLKTALMALKEAGMKELRLSAKALPWP
ncbi:MAG: MarR family transcriptional regulator, partial [Deltaproteobacteria bacterium]